ncbi:cytochrome P450 2C20-like isoform X2 [Watersipora subatra]|uniref:cytochrome P450 2C20-like isoform X2 n=1 Tax=Watersipora subatra TaxID=2589382 RepID=UPI00355B42C7
MEEIIEKLVKLTADATWEMYGAAITAVVVAYYVSTKVWRRSLPPGPTPLPILGSALGILGQPLYVTFEKLRQQYGDVFCIRVGSKNIVVINGYEAITEALVTNSRKFSGRPAITWTGVTEGHGFFSLSGPVYHQQKGVIMEILSGISWNKKEATELRIQKSAANLIAWLEEKVGEPVDPHVYLNTAVCNVNTEPVMGLTFAPTDDLMVAVSKIAMEIFIDAGAQNVNNYFTFLRHLPGDPTNYKVLVNNAMAAKKVVIGVIQSHKEKFEENPTAERADFIDHYLQKLESGADPSCTEKQLIAVVLDLFAMAIEAPATSLRWAILLACKHPEAQKQIQHEIDTVMKGEAPALQHQPEMHYTNAFIHEVQRYVNLASINLPHATTDNVTFRGYSIPKGTIVIPNLASIHFDSQTYAEPRVFKPERFLSSGAFQKPKEFMPFSAGTRVCPGANIGRWLLFLFLTTILQRFSVRLEGGVGADKYGLIRFPGDFKAVFDERGQKANAVNGTG